MKKRPFACTSGTPAEEDSEPEVAEPAATAVTVMDTVGLGDFDNLSQGLWAKCQVLDTNPERTLKSSPGRELLGKYNV